MADALCGPSNALQNFQKHTAVDRTLQQDKLVNHQPSAQQGFRSQNPNASILDAEFQAFENNFAGNATPLIDRAGPFGTPVHPQAYPAIRAPDAGDWASDFQKLRVSGPPQSLHQHPIMLGQGTHGERLESWQDQFARHQQQNNQDVVQQSTPMANFHHSFRPSYQMTTGPLAPITNGQETMQVQANAVVEPVTYDESAFAAAFEQVQADIDQQHTVNVEQHQLSEADQPQLDSEHPAQSEASEKIRIGSDLIVNTTDADVQDRKEDPDDLARTAGHLLDSLSHDNSKKFKESNFLALMRRIRDREVHVDGDEFREVSTLP